MIRFKIAAAPLDACAFPSRSKLIVLDMDATGDPTHGMQQLCCFHGYYDQYMLHPLLIFNGLTGIPVASVSEV